MSSQINPWWSLPVITLVVGCVSGYAFVDLMLIDEARQQTAVSAPPQVKVSSYSTVESNQVENYELAVEQVALPPPPVYQPRLTAKVVNQQVVVSNDSSKLMPATTTKNSKAPEQVIDPSSQLAQRFSKVLAEMEQDSQQPKAKLHAQPLAQYPQWYQNLVPELEFSSHIYASDINERWVRVNNQVVKQGELINASMRLIAIEPQQVVIEMQQRQFTLPALSSW
ncbi:general secretion pathway protein GspB [Psychrobium sp. 1_MG-2023]|uniref:general secretion pathway protein GspB n=1 Tax=Psychrobium sp. 1_MG-2023 TaxID=3062624 RepID=UPI002736F49C|nr:general secretion pathway protein GspB [Psychrobium sp. 1_MG-2023]MDP2560736.1 general secretion pathway protein GspB [Psychrobium sp. 1_MG-2023]